MADGCVDLECDFLIPLAAWRFDYLEVRPIHRRARLVSNAGTSHVLTREAFAITPHSSKNSDLPLRILFAYAGAFAHR
jgi:hypothetical protein